MSVIPVTWEVNEYLDIKLSMENLMIDSENKIVNADVLIVKLKR